MKLYQIDKQDTVAIAIEDIAAGETIPVADTVLTTLEPIPKGHKVALMDLPKGSSIIKYGSVIGEASENIRKGQWIHTHNTLSHADDLRTFTYHFDPRQVVLPGSGQQTFRGYRRPSGEVGIRNYILVLSGVFCANSHIKEIVRRIEQKYPKCEGFDGFLPLTHECGCGQEGQDLENVRRALAGLMQNGNVGGILFVEVGCEINYFETIRQYIDFFDESRFRRITMQMEDDEYVSAEKALAELYEIAKTDRREVCPLSDLHIGANCGGSDGFSGLTGNKMVGEFAEHLVKNGGTFTITEVTEMFGAEQILMNRAVNREIFQKIEKLITQQRDYIMRYGGTANGNPSYGNKQGGITTIEDKSLGCVQKGGKCAVSDVVFYADRVRTKGFNLVQGPGSDLVGVTAQVVAGAVMEIFTTGRGTPVAFAVPTIKVATNTPIFEKKRSWMDFNAGELIHGQKMGQLLDAFITLILKAASGEYQTSNERMGFYEIAFQRDGVIL